ncbi:Testis-expressed gene 16 [Apodemus speciosus]|uniref:Testis-expressed gene 16 n=1 Tax=Apodemus speciosus TaxID=105296 RepID=A0ABQ0FV07_APOSI
MAQLFRYFQGDPVVTSSPTEVRMWVEELDYSFLSYGEIFESAEINGERLLNITRTQLNELGIVSTDHQDILLQAVGRIRKRGKTEEQAMYREDQNIKKMPTRFGKESEQLEHAIDRVLVTISERRLARSLHGTVEQPPHSILTATLELVNIASTILNILESSDLSHENESDIIDMCKGVTKMCHYIISLPPDLPKPERRLTRPAPREDRPPRVQVPITTEPETMSSSVKRKADYTPLTQHLSMPMTTTTLSYEPPMQYASVQNQRVSESYSSSPRVESPSDEGAFTLECNKGYKSETEIQDTDAFETLGGSFYYKTLQDLTIIESDTPLMDSGSEKCMIDSDSDRGVVSDFELEEQSKDSGSVIWGLDSDSEKSPRDSDSRKPLFKEETYQLDSVSVEDLTRTGKHLVRIEQCQMESGSLKSWMPSGSEKSLEDSNSERFSDSDNERQKEEFQMASASVQCLMESEKTKMENENLWMIPDSESYSVDSHTEKGRASTSKVHLIQADEREKPRIKRYMMDSDSDPSETDSDSERCEFASAAVKYFMDTKTFQESSTSNQFPKDSWSESRTINSDSESPVMSSDSMKYMKKAETCKSTCNLERLKVAHKSESLQDWLDAKRKQLESDNAGYWDSSGKYQFTSIVPQESIGKCRGDLQTSKRITKKHEVGSRSDKHQKQFGNERDKNEPECKRHLIKTEKGLDNDGFQMDEEREGYLVESDSRDSENEAHLREAYRLGARRKENRPPGFWRPITLPPKLAQEKKIEEQKSVQQKDSRVSRIQLTRYKSEDKNVRFTEASSSLSDKELSQEKLKEKHSYSFSPESHTFTDEKHHRKASRKTSVYKRHCKEYRYSHSCESLKYQISPIPLSFETSTSNVSSFVGSPTSKSPKSVTRKKTRRSITYSPELGTQKCTRCFMEISNTSFHKCLKNSDDSDSDSPLHGQISSHSKYSLRSKTTRHFKTSRNRPLSQSLDPQHSVVSRCSLHREDTKYSIDSTSYLHCESCSALQNLKGSSVTHTISKNTEKIMGQHSTHGHIMSAPVSLSPSESQFNLTTQPQNKDTPDDSDTIFISARNIETEANVEDTLLYKDETDHEDETNTEDETDGEDETDTEDEDDTKDKKDPKDKSDPDGSDPKDGNSENNTDSNNGSQPSGSSGPMGGPDSSNDGDSKNVTDHKNESDPTIDNATNSDVNLKYSTDEKCTNNLDNASDLAEYFKRQNNADIKRITNPASGNKTRTVLDYVSGSNNEDTGPRNAIIKGNIAYAENIRLLSNSHQNNFIKNGSDPHSNPSPPNSFWLPKDLDSNSNINPSNATNNIANCNYGTKPTSIAVYKQMTALNYYSDINNVTGFTYKVRSSFVVNSNYFDRKKYGVRPSFALCTIDAIDTHVTTCTSAINFEFTAEKTSALDTKHFPRFSHFRSFNVIISPNYNGENIQNANNSTSISNISNLPATELEINSILSVLKIIYGNIPNFIAGTNYPDFLLTSEFYEPLGLGRAYKNFDVQNIGAPSQYCAGYMDSDNSTYATGPIDALDAKESGFLKDISRIQTTIGIKDPSSIFKVLSKQNIPLPSFDVLVEAELPDIVKFTISSSAVNQLFEWKICNLDMNK